MVTLLSYISLRLPQPAHLQFGKHRVNMDKYIEIFEIKTLAKCAKVNASSHLIMAISRGLPKGGVWPHAFNLRPRINDFFSPPQI